MTQPEVEVARALSDTVVKIGTRGSTFGSVGRMDEASCLKIAKIALDAVRCAQGRDTDAPECQDCGHVLDRHQAQEGMCLDCECPGWSPQGEDHEAAMSAARHAFLDASTLRLLPAQWDVLVEENLPAAVAAYRAVLAGDHDQGAHDPA